MLWISNLYGLLGELMHMRGLYIRGTLNKHVIKHTLIDTHTHIHVCTHLWSTSDDDVFVSLR